MDDYARQSRHPRPSGVGIALVVLLHLLLLWAIQSGMALSVGHKVQVVVQAVLLSEDRPAPPPAAKPPPPAPKPSPPLPSPLPRVETPAVTAAPAAPNAIAVAPAVPAVPVAAAPGPRSESVRTAAVVNAAQCDKPEYPSASRRLEEEGTVHLRFLVGVDGKVIQSEVEKSSGYKRLDEAARAGLARCQFRPATVDGKPEQAWASMRYTWRLE